MNLFRVKSLDGGLNTKEEMERNNQKRKRDKER